MHTQVNDRSAGKRDEVRDDEPRTPRNVPYPAWAYFPSKA